jgi:phosphate transport system protein
MTSGVRPRLRRKIEKLNETLLGLGALVEQSLHLAVKALDRKDEELAHKVLEGDMEIDRVEVDLEEECLEILALHQPVAVDLRHIVGVLKINKDLERAADLAGNVANIALDLTREPDVTIPEDYFLMAGKTEEMLKKALDAYVNRAPDAAYEVLQGDDEVDRMKRELHKQFFASVAAAPKLLEPLTLLFLVSRHLERIADLATNIAEEVIYIVTGEIVRHGRAFPDGEHARKKQRRKNPADG